MGQPTRSIRVALVEEAEVGVLRAVGEEMVALG
jgi:hypothetical protein